MKSERPLESSQGNQIQKVNTNHIFGKNAGTLFCYSTMKLVTPANTGSELADRAIDAVRYGIFGLPLAFFWEADILLSLITVPVIGGFATLIEASTRHELTYDQLAEIKTNLDNLTLKEFHGFLTGILLYSHPVSEESKKLLASLKTDSENINIKIQENINNFKTSLIEDKQKEKLKVYENNPDLNINYTHINLNDNEIAEIDRSVTEYSNLKAKEEAWNATKAKQIDTICKYINNDINAGKKLQNIILQESTKAKSIKI